MADTALHHQHLLVVDDNPVNVELLLDLLEDRGFDASQLRKVPQRPEQVGQPGFQ